MSDSNDLSELNSRVEQAVCLLQSFQEQQTEVEAQVRDQLTRTLQVIRQQQQELKHANDFVRTCQTEAAQLRSMLQRLLKSVEAVGSDASRSFVEELGAELAMLAQEPQVDSAVGNRPATPGATVPSDYDRDASIRKRSIDETSDSENPPTNENGEDRENSSQLGHNSLMRTLRPRPFRTGRI